jgi:hypothetical protein
LHERAHSSPLICLPFCEDGHNDFDFLLIHLEPRPRRHGYRVVCSVCPSLLAKAAIAPAYPRHRAMVHCYLVRDQTLVMCRTARAWRRPTLGLKEPEGNSTTKAV